MDTLTPWRIAKHTAMSAHSPLAFRPIEDGWVSCYWHGALLRNVLVIEPESGIGNKGLVYIECTHNVVFLG
jgi:hypothetical protein